MLALLANFGIALAKFVGYFLTQSASMLAESIHSLVDCTNQALLLIGAKSSARPPDQTHPLGYGRDMFFWSFVVAVLLFSIGGVFAIYEGVHKLQHPTEIEAPWVAISVLVVALGLEGGSFFACVKEVNRVRGSHSIWAWIRSTTSAELLVVFTEDLAALLGLVIALVCLVLSLITGQSMWDAVGSILVGLVLVSVAILVAVEIRSLLLGEAPAEDLRPLVDGIVKQELEGAKVLNFIALQTGSAELMVALKFDPGRAALDASGTELIQSINRMERKIREAIPAVRWLFVEPDVED